MRTPLVRILLNIVLLLLARAVEAQEIRITHQAPKDFAKIKSSHPFYFLQPGIDTTTVTYVATLVISSSATTPALRIYNKIEDQACTLGANSFGITTHTATQLEVNLYLASEDAVTAQEPLPRNTLYIFGHDRDEAKAYDYFEINDVSKSIQGGTYYQYELKEGEQIKLKKGNITGTVLWVKWKPEGSTHYYSIHGFYKPPVVKKTTVSRAVKAGKFTSLDGRLGAFLATVLMCDED